jgi:integration host factor subunit alpha
MVKKNFTRRDLSNQIYKKIGFSKNLSSTIVDDFFEIIINEVIKNNKVKISSFGTFSILNKKERVGRNPKTKVLAKITSRKVVKFRPSLLLKNKLNNNE